MERKGAIRIFDSTDVTALIYARGGKARGVECTVIPRGCALVQIWQLEMLVMVGVWVAETSPFLPVTQTRPSRRAVEAATSNG